MSALEQAVAELGQDIAVRNLRAGDFISPELRLGFKMLDANWTWVAVSHGTIVAALLAAPCHGMVFLVRLVTAPGFGWTLPRLLRQFIRDALNRGFVGYVAYLDPVRKEESKLLSILKRAKCSEVADIQTCVGGKLSDLERW